MISLYWWYHLSQNKELKSQSKRLWLGKDPDKIENPVLKMKFSNMFQSNMYKNSIFTTEFSILLGSCPYNFLDWFFNHLFKRDIFTLRALHILLSTEDSVFTLCYILLPTETIIIVHCLLHLLSTEDSMFTLPAIFNLAFCWWRQNCLVHLGKTANFSLTELWIWHRPNLHQWNGIDVKWLALLLLFSNIFIDLTAATEHFNYRSSIKHFMGYFMTFDL